jgi:hypothetical protein
LIRRPILPFWRRQKASISITYFHNFVTLCFFVR